MKNKSFAIMAICLVILGCGSISEVTKLYDDKDMGLRKTALSNENLQLEDINYTQADAGTSTKVARSFENAPPLIPHSTEGLLPITTDNNICLTCHMPEYAEAVGSTPIPKSHLFSLRDGKDLYGKLSDARFNCTQCHVPQANVTPLVKNNFKADFRDEGSKEKSNLLDVLNEGVR